MACALFFVPYAASAQSALIEFTSSMNSFSADFTQTVYDSDSVALQESVGSVELLRPGRFRWSYQEPTSQLIVADGLTLWVYDEDIKQVTVQPQSSTLGSAPIGLLSGQRSIESEFTVTELGVEKGLQWFELTPLEKDTDFHTLYIALDDMGLHAMELRDNFDQATQIKFSNFKKNISIDAGRFAFEPPEGADVIGEMGTASPDEPEGEPGEGTGEEAPQAARLPEQEQQPDQRPDQQPDQQNNPDELPLAEVEALPETKRVIDGDELQFEETIEPISE